MTTNKMQHFDIASLLRFMPPQVACERCCALLPHLDGICPVCGVEYILTEEFPTYTDYFRQRGLTIQFHDLIEHSQRLARIARQIRESNGGQTSSSYPPMRALLTALHSAERFVHFTTYGMSALLLGALKLTAQRVDVRGIVSGVKSDIMMREMTDYQDEAPHLHLRAFSGEETYFPHQKIIVIDGLMAFKGSANMTDIGWRKAARGQEIIEVVTDVAEVVELNNRFFSPAWAGDHAGERILMTAY
ncbi:MAG: hypothetical protein JNL42_07410 [Anaerolineae bacterium]|nr:hypothetical protein [Anaerolineae bacterium]